MYEIQDNELEALYAHEDLLGNTLMELGSNTRVLNHHLVNGMRVRPDSSGRELVVEIFAHKTTRQLLSVIREEFGSHRVLLHHLKWGLVFEIV
ncbi:hypothetical protein GF359_00730 [candidate division WOR-3 bacterium]|uniref:Uncharacterized protein n=1 Tax=candidate division WOR-3 bacterium TaxID=2052148 RepID=A0A9D5QBL1_UNCW3|nr:hypothetical protein [candidate division WOR-3 bacterium]MBD3363718.1 hypothetical protein [candidate division WOR-3 bacterium]